MQFEDIEPANPQVPEDKTEAAPKRDKKKKKDKKIKVEQVFDSRPDSFEIEEPPQQKIQKVKKKDRRSRNNNGYEEAQMTATPTAEDAGFDDPDDVPDAPPKKHRRPLPPVSRPVRR